MKIAFIHPDLGIGGAERLVVDAAVALQQQGHAVTIFTSHHDPAHAFDETRDGTLDVRVLGNSVFPRSVLGRLAILMATLRQLHLAVELVGRSKAKQGQNSGQTSSQASAAVPPAAAAATPAATDYDVFFIDQLPAAVPYLRYAFPHARILFYCHHPDLLLTARGSLLKRAYRAPFDRFERWSTARSDLIAVNSEYTRQVFFSTFGRHAMPDPHVLYPVVDAQELRAAEFWAPFPELEAQGRQIAAKLGPYCLDRRSKAPMSDEPRFVLSINRFERKKDVELAVTAFSLLLHSQPEHRDHLLVIAGGYDARVKENIEHLAELERLAAKFRMPSATLLPDADWTELNLAKTRILFLPSVATPTKQFLLRHAAALLYTPTNEHFGIVPLEALAAETPVLATNTGGPLETVVDGECGWLRPADVEEWHHVLGHVLIAAPGADLARMGAAGRERVLREFSMHTLRPRLDALVGQTAETERRHEAQVTRESRQVFALVAGGAALAVPLGLVVAWLVVRFLLWAVPILVASTQW